MNPISDNSCRLLVISAKLQPINKFNMPVEYFEGTPCYTYPARFGTIDVVKLHIDDEVQDVMRTIINGKYVFFDVEDFDLFVSTPGEYFFDDPEDPDQESVLEYCNYYWSQLSEIILHNASGNEDEFIRGAWDNPQYVRYRNRAPWDLRRCNLEYRKTSDYVDEEWVNPIRVGETRRVGERYYINLYGRIATMNEM